MTQKRVLPATTQQLQIIGEDPGKEKLSARLLRVVSILVVGLAKFVGFIPFQHDTTTNNNKITLHFKLFSFKTLFSWLRLVLITFPIYFLPLILFFTFLSDEEAKSRSYGFLENMIFDLEYFVNFLVYLLPITFAYVSARPLGVCWNICTAEHNSDIEKEIHVVKQAMVPILGLVLFLIGKAFRTISIFSLRSEAGVSSMNPGILAYCDLCVHFLIHFPLHSFLASYEFFFYQTLNHYQLLAKRLLNTQEAETLLIRTAELTSYMENAKEAEGFFLLINLTLMLFFWLVHTYLAYLTFQVGTHHLKLA